MLLIYLCIATLTVIAGAGIAIIFKAREWEFRMIFGLTAGAVLGFVLMLMVHQITETRYWTIVVLWGGFLFVWMLEKTTYWLGNQLTNEEKDKKKTNWRVNIALIGLSIHSIGDGFNLSVAAEDQEIGLVLALAILIHRLPVATVIATPIRSIYGGAQTLFRLTPLLIAPFIGAYVGEQLLQGILNGLIEYITVFAAGTLLHVVMEGIQRGTVKSEGKIHYSTKFAFVIGLIITLCAYIFIPGIEHDHVH
ncbi:hypothetical protein JT359_11845 [Candidatus Poribacteria bacterium]|nr:hypothetical protein [Candidatus Poribacteria bacterium]